MSKSKIKTPAQRPDFRRSDEYDFPPYETEPRHREPSVDIVEQRSHTTSELGEQYRDRLEESSLSVAEYDEQLVVKGTSPRNTRQREEILKKEVQPAIDRAYPEDKPELIQEEAELVIEQAYADLYFYREDIEKKLQALQDHLHEVIVYQETQSNLAEMLGEIRELKMTVMSFEEYTRSAVELVLDYAKTYHDDGANLFLEEKNEELFLAIGMNKNDLPPHYQDQTHIFQYYANQLGTKISFDLLEEIIEARLQRLAHSDQGRESENGGSLQDAVEQVQAFQKAQGNVLSFRSDETHQRAA